MGNAHRPVGSDDRALRLGWFAAVVFVAVFGVGAFASWIIESIRDTSWWAIDLAMVIEAARRLGGGDPLYADPKFLYPPLAAVVATPLVELDGLLVSIAYALAKLLLAGLTVAWLSRAAGVADRVLAAAAVLLSLPFLHDVFLGNANAILVAAMALAAFGPNRAWAGIAIGVVAAIFAKPFLVPFGLWLLVARRRVLAGTLLAGLGATAIGAMAAGVPAYVAWIEALVAGGRYATPFAGNHGITALWPAAWAPVALVTAVALVVVLVRAGSAVSHVWSVTSGILLAPYAGTYSALPAALAMPVIARQSRWLAIGIVAVSPVATIHPLPFYAAAIMIGSLVLARRRPLALPETSPAPPAPATR